MEPKVNSLKRLTKLTAVMEANKKKRERERERRLKLLESEMKKGTSLPTSQK